ncbi:hypothetical protein WR25_16598 [Diploscapter pachys]|uniref:Uncharacterized protein n=1 Tax=Diploscapter pachys TaxID=2018661 RepID=A0A2A2K147_9BILA|nr:hypothetical protein WR25_16598 [Diploscapter pachys]
MTDHQPRFGPHHGEVVADRLRVRRPHADVDQRDAGAIVGHQVIGRHLMPPPRAVVDQLVDVAGLVDHDIAGTRQGREARTLTQLRRSPANEFIDIAVIVRKQYEALRMLRRRPHIVTQARETEIGAQRVEQRQRTATAFGDPQAVRDLIADMGEFGRREMPRQFGRRHGVEAQRMTGIEHIGERDFLPPRHRLDLDVIILDQQRQLFGQIIRKQRGLGDADRIVAGRHQPPERPRRRRPVARRGIAQADDGIGERAVEAALRRRRRAIGQIGVEGRLQAVDGSAVEAVEFGNDLGSFVRRDTRDVRQAATPCPAVGLSASVR